MMKAWLALSLVGLGPGVIHLIRGYYYCCSARGHEYIEPSYRWKRRHCCCSTAHDQLVTPTISPKSLPQRIKQRPRSATSGIGLFESCHWTLKTHSEPLICTVQHNHGCLRAACGTHGRGSLQSCHGESHRSSSKSKSLSALHTEIYGSVGL